MSSTPSFEDVVRGRHSKRGFTFTPVPDELLKEVLIDAQCSPSNCNSQPWEVHIVRGEKLKALAEILVEKTKVMDFKMDYPFNQDSFPCDMNERAKEQGALMYSALGVARDDKDGRFNFLLDNCRFFGAYQAAFLFMPVVEDNVRVAGDLGMYAQNFLLSLHARGLGGCPQTLLGFHAEPVREFLGIPNEKKLLFGISFGYIDESHPSNKLEVPRMNYEQSVTIHQ